ncbi:CrcB family protein [Ureibacillus chungkukjangi]|uniref:Uncharacterized protein n=1 Tax=Ureibacillus chungkukjangi TaxID=1202712 RepID=A0A318TPB0_9BACL|nr:CrcB family protein [Ureibacillus chungkukjangi]PYF05700.1 hypothetical protein BJ095_11648 [Ureibacillus chungkukjangi]
MGNSKVKAKITSNLVVPAFFGAGIGAFLGLLAYVKDWLSFL